MNGAKLLCWLSLMVWGGLCLPPAATGACGQNPRIDGDGEYDRRLVELGFVDVRQLDPTIMVELKYACTDNFMKANVYGSLTQCYLRPEAAAKLAEASRILKEAHPHLRLLVADGFRPRHVQRKMWDLVKETSMRVYVADPSRGSMHNYGCAVDVTLTDRDGVRLDMGTPIDHFGPLSEPRREIEHLASGRLTPRQVANRRILREVMTGAGFLPLAIEWWHFDAFDKTTVRERFEIVE